MLKNFLIVATRNFLRQRFYSFINVFGLATGLASAIFIMLWVNDELNVDRGFADSDRIYQVISNFKLTDKEVNTWNSTPGPLGDAVMSEVPEVEYAVRVNETGARRLRFAEKTFLREGLYVDSTFFKVFDFNIEGGTTEKFDRNSIALSRNLATVLFGNEDPIGQTVRLGKSIDLEVLAVFDDIVRGTTLKMDYAISYERYRTERGDGFNWGNFDHPLYLKLHDGASLEQASAKINAIMDREMDAQEDTKPGDTDAFNFYMMPMADYYLNSNFENGVPVGGRIEYVRIFSIVAIFIVLIACINFTNMATARAVQRAKEVGVRKVVGAQKRSLVSQFIGESLITTLISMVLAVGIVFMLLPLFNELVSKEMEFSLTNPYVLLSCTGMVVFAGLAAGLYPAFFLSSYQPVQVLKGSVGSGFRGAGLRKSLVVFQFALTVIMIACAIVIKKQVDFIREKNLGYDRNSVIHFTGYADMIGKFDAFRNEASKIPGVIMMGRSNNSLVEVQNQNGSVWWPGKPENENIFFRTVTVDHSYLQTMGVKLVEGRFFNNTIADTASYIISQRSAEIMGLQNPIGTQMSQWDRKGAIIGVVEDIHARSMHEGIDPLVFMYAPDWNSNVYVRYDPSKTAEVIEGITQLAKKFAPEFPFHYAFVDDDFERLYNSEKVTGSLALGFTIITIIISGLGLLALAAYTAERKRKEISIRKTLGASAGTIMGMMAKDFAKLSINAAIVGCPVAWLMMKRFLEGYAYHIDLSWDVFVITALLTIILSIVTVIFQVGRAAIANPVDALRNE